MIRKRNISICGIVGLLFLFVVSLASVNVGNAAEQLITITLFFASVIKGGMK